MVDLSLLQLFIPTFFMVSLVPGMCMLLAMSLGMAVGFRKTLFMMLGEVLGVALVAIASVLGLSAIMLKFPFLFNFIKLFGAAYLGYLAVNLWLSKGKLALDTLVSVNGDINRLHLFSQGFLTAITNPKGWAFMFSLLPPFINPQYPLPLQLSCLVVIIMLSEFICMMLYASGGRVIGKLLTQSHNVKRLNKLTASIMMGIAIWLVLG